MGRRSARDAAFIQFYAARSDHLRRTAYLLCGDWHLAEDLTQIAVTKLYQAWERVDRHDSLDQYARRILLRAFLDERRRPWRREVPTAPDPAVLEASAVAAGSPDDRMLLRSALLQVPKGRRAVLVLRFWADLSVEQVADILGCSTGTVKSQTAHGLADLRRVLGGTLDDLKHPGGRT
jgi:RNA polymerase sigma-70 factor (sigma-E family)